MSICFFYNSINSNSTKLVQIKVRLLFIIQLYNHIFNFLIIFISIFLSNTSILILRYTQEYIYIHTNSVTNKNDLFKILEVVEDCL